MYKHYLKQMLQLFKENKLISGISIFGTALSICMIMVIVIIYQMHTENMAPETGRDRMLYINGIAVEEDGSQGMSGISRYLMIEAFTKLKRPACVVAVSRGNKMILSVPGMKKSEKGVVLPTDASFWKMFDFKFIAGSAYTEEEFESGLKCVVIDEAYARSLYGSAEMAIGKRIDVDFKTYTVKGVVKSVNPFFQATYANAWIPYAALPGYAGRTATSGRGGGYFGALSCYILAKSSSDIPAIKLELQETFDRLNANNKKYKVMLKNPPLTHFDQMFRYKYQYPSEMKLRYIFIIILLLLIPAINLTGLTFSHMQKRQSEMGVRRVFGATKLQLLKQVLIENLLNTLLGGIVGLLLAYLSLWFFDELLLQPTSQGETMLSLDMLHPMVFVYAFLFCLILNCLSAGIPAWRVSRANIVSSINN